MSTKLRNLFPIFIVYELKYTIIPIFMHFLLALTSKMRYTLVVLSFKTSACPCGGIGRRTGLKILRDLTLVPVQVWPRAPT